MKRPMPWTVTIAAMCLLLQTGLVTTACGEEYAIKAAKREQAAVVDGVAGKDEYPGSAIALKQTPERGNIQGEAPQAWVYHDGKTLYVCVTVPFKAGSELSKGESWGSNDGAEVCFRNASGAQPGPTFVIHGYATGKHESITEAGAPEDESGKLEKAVKFAAKAEKQSWTGEWSIPLVAAGISYQPGMKLGFNIGLYRSESGEWIAWRGTDGANYQLDGAGTLTLE